MQDAVDGWAWIGREQHVTQQANLVCFENALIEDFIFLYEHRALGAKLGQHNVYTFPLHTPGCCLNLLLTLCWHVCMP